MQIKERAFQDRGSVRHCHGCGADNERGLRLKSFWDGEEAVAKWHPQPHHCGGRREILNGGIIASLIDCHSMNLAIARAYRVEGREIGSAPRIGYVTANLQVRYLKPVPIDQSVELRARIVKLEGRKAWVRCDLSSDGEIRAQGEALGIRVNWD